MRRRELTKPLGHPVFRRLGASYVIDELGDWMGIVALSVLVFDRTGSAPATAALFLGTRFLPALLAPILVARVERPPPRFVLPVIYAAEALAFGLLALLVEHFSLLAVVAVAAVDGTLTLTGRSLTRAVIASLLEPTGELRAGNALLNIALTAGAAIGPALAGLVAAGFGVQAALLLDAVSFYVIAWVVLTAGPLPRAAPEEGQVRERIRAAIVYLRKEAYLRRLLIAQGAALIFFAAVIPIEVVYAKETLGTGDAGYGIMLGSWGLGMVLGSLIFAGAQKVALPVLLFFGTVAVGAGYLGLAAAPTLVVACAASVVGGAGNGVQWVSAISAVQELTVPNMQARVMSFLWSVGAAMPGVGYILGAAIAVILDPRVTFLVAGLGVLAIVSLAALTMGRKWLRSGEKADESAIGAELEIMVELIPVGGVQPAPDATRRL